MSLFEQLSAREQRRLQELLIQRVEAIFNQRYPSWMLKVINPYLERLQTQQSVQQTGFDFTLLKGETQQGKTLVWHIVAWLLIWKFGYVPCYVTKNIKVLRDDAIDKLNNGAVNQIVDEVAAGISQPDMAKRFHLKAQTGLRYTGVTRGQIPIYLMNAENNLWMLKWMKRLKHLVGTTGMGTSNKEIYPIFFIDEVHELYPSDSVEHYLNTGRLPELTKAKIRGHHLIHRIMDFCKKNLCGMIGITATPQRMLCSDPEVCPTKIYTIPCEPPREGLVRIGYDDQTDEIQGVEFHQEIDPIQIIKQILERPTLTLSDGRCAVKFLNIVTEHEKADMAALHEIISEHFDDSQVYVKTFMEQTTGYHDINVKELDQFFDLRQVPNSVITNGVMILIGKSREGAGITIKPSFKARHYEKEVDGTLWTITGITDLKAKVGGNMEGTEQLLGRATGWFDRNHRLHMWLPEKHIHDVRYGIIQSKNAMIQSYQEGLSQGNIGPISVLKITNKCTAISHFTPNMFYKSATRTRRGHINTGALRHVPTNNGGQVHELTTTVYDLPDEYYQEYLEACMAPGGGNSEAGRKIRGKIIGYLNSEYGLAIRLSGNFIQLPWADTRSGEILKAVAQPRGSSQWRVNGYGVVRGSKMSMVIFDEPYGDRLQFGYECKGCNRGDCQDHLPINDTIYWYDGELYRYATYDRCMEHKYAEKIENWALDQQAYVERLDQIDKLVEDLREAIRKKSLWNFFQSLHTSGNYNSKRPSGLHYQKWISGLWSSFKSEYSETHAVMEAKIKDPELGEDDLMIEFEELLQPYFNATFHQQPRIRLRPVLRARAALQAPAVKIRPRLRIRP